MGWSNGDAVANGKVRGAVWALCSLFYYLCCAIAGMCATIGLVDCCSSCSVLLWVLEELGGRKEDALKVLIWSATNWCLCYALAKCGRKFVISRLCCYLRTTISVILNFAPGLHWYPIFPLHDHPGVWSLSTKSISNEKKGRTGKHMSFPIAYLLSTFRLLIYLFLHVRVPPWCWELVVPVAWGGGIWTKL